ncbi:hypothetical protein JCGZ_05093 [Jatropha curcas]|uniref:Uncharacterized protein n=1 Tax=Jatropha curcas TaxID=180498 RepID=A0A067LF12_JATCU|nr:hypothetical protein JCGZ_05093 [Jatropha curcas]
MDSASAQPPPPLSLPVSSHQSRSISSPRRRLLAAATRPSFPFSPFLLLVSAKITARLGLQPDRDSVFVLLSVSEQLRRLSPIR